MPDPGIYSDRLMDAAPVVRLPPVPTVLCPGCHADLASLPAVARFCNRCGVALSPAKRPRSLRTTLSFGTPPRRTAFRSPRWLSNLWGACADGGPESLAPAGRSAVLLAYGKSMFNLGWRYEHAIGARRNLDEAVLLRQGGTLGRRLSRRAPEPC